METVEKNEGIASVQKKYLALISLIEGIENRLKWSEMFYILLNVVVFMMIINLVAATIKTGCQEVPPIHLLFIFFSHAIGIIINTFWLAASMRLQLKLKLRYFQARFLERKINREGEYLFSDESLFFNPAIRRVESTDGKEPALTYPTKGFLRMDGIIGAARPRLLALFMPFLFFIIYITSLFSVLNMVLC
ncbi:MAG: hypothetical protein Q7U02_11120 [Desulfosalsimonadaceae bacterium]|nr:hypothetical protein [Desulfosalsimonadaceae bacterium]